MVVQLSNICAALAVAMLLLPFWLAASAGQAEMGPAMVMMGHLTAWTLGALVLAGCLLVGAFDWVPARPMVRWLMAYSTHLVLAMSSLATAPHGAISTGRFLLSVAMPLAVLTYLVLLLNPELRVRVPAPAVRVPAILTGGVAAALATVTVPASVEAIRENWRQAQALLEQAEQRRTEQLREERESMEVLSRLPLNAGLFELLPFVDSGSDRARIHAAERIGKIPGLVSRLVAVLDAGDPSLRRQVTFYLAKHYDGPAEGLCAPVAGYLARLRTTLSSELAEPWPRSRDYYLRVAGALEATQKLARQGCRFETERGQWARSLKARGGGLLRDLLSSKLHTTESGDQPKLVTTVASR